ncbi:MAG TPA: FlgD immunoglobulin-like domain containing protein, partial [Candidatus Eisenbacteria bacterium]
RSADPGFTPGPSNLVHSTTATSWTDASFTGGTVYYKLTAVDFSGNESAPASTSITVGVGDVNLPARFALHAIAPNPVRERAVLAYDVPAAGGAVRLGLYDVGGRLVRSLVDGPQTPGQKSVAWDGRDDLGHALAAGMYFVRMRAVGFTQVRKFVMTR